MAGKKGFKAVEEDIEELDEQIRSHRKTIARRIICVVGVLLILFVAAELYLALRSFSGYSISSTTERHDSDAVYFEAFGNNLLKYSNDGAVCMDGQNNQIWNQSYEMISPAVSICEDYLAIYDRSGIDLYILSKSNPVKHLEMPTNIVSVSIASQGTVAVLMKDESASKVAIYDKAGEELASGAFYPKNGGFPVDIALSYDAKKMAIAMVDVSDGNLKSTIAFYNFGSVGKTEINNNVGTFSYSDMFIPEIEYVSSNRMLALGDNEVIIFEGSEKPSVAKEIFPESEPRSIVYNNKYVCIVTDSTEEEEANHISLYNHSGKKTMDADTSIAYEEIYFLNNGELCLMNHENMEIYTPHGIKKFKHQFTEEIDYALSQGKGVDYIFIFDDSTQEVRLR